MLFEGQAVQCRQVEGKQGGRVIQLEFNLKGDSVNKFNAATLAELKTAIQSVKEALAKDTIQGVLLTSGKDCFIVGADVTEFLSHFKKSEDQLRTWIADTQSLFSEIEDLPVPTVAAINGFALGGGFEVALATCYRVMSSETKVGLPETKLGIFPGWGGTVRLSRVTGADTAIEWIASGEQWRAADALKVGAVDAVVAPDQVRAAALDLIEQCASGKLDWKKKRDEKLSPLQLSAVESTMVFEGAKAFVGAKAGPNYPAPVAAIEVIQKGARLGRDAALQIEAEAFAKTAKTPTAHALVSLFLADQAVKKISKKISLTSLGVNSAAVLGAGIMGGGIAYQSASSKVPILMKDIQPASLELGMTEAIKLLDKAVSRGKMTTTKMAQVLSGIKPTLTYGDFGQVDFVVEAVVENEKIKKSVLSEVEGLVKPGTVLASNTSTISISRLAEGLKNPENFVGMHFFNPVPKMPLVEVIRGKKSSELAIAAAVSYALKMGKTPIVVNDCPGFLINRVLFPYFAGFIKLIGDGVDYKRIDKVMEKFGWPMGPAYLLDVVGIDTAHHANSVMAQEFPDRMKSDSKTVIELMFEKKRFGQKNGIGFYQYKPDKKGSPKKEIDPEVEPLLKTLVGQAKEVSDQEIVERMMLPMMIEASRCLEDHIVSSPLEVDLGLIYGLGYPPFRGGVFRTMDQMGVRSLCETAKKYVGLGKLYEPTLQMKQIAESGKGFYPEV